MEHLKRILFNKDLEQDLKKKLMGDFYSIRNNAITGNEEKLSGSHLMQMYSINSEVDIFDIIHDKYGNRVALKGGKDPCDIEIIGANIGFNVKAYNKQTNNYIKLCSKSTIESLASYDYKFILMIYTLSKLKDSINCDAILVFDFKDIKSYITLYQNTYYISFNKIKQYIQLRDGIAENIQPL